MWAKKGFKITSELSTSTWNSLTIHGMFSSVRNVELNIKLVFLSYTVTLSQLRKLFVVKWDQKVINIGTVVIFWMWAEFDGGDWTKTRETSNLVATTRARYMSLKSTPTGTVTGRDKVKLSQCCNWSPRHEGVLGVGGVAQHILDFGTTWWWVVSFTPRPLYPQVESPWYPLDRRLVGPQSQAGRGGEEENSQPLPGLEPPIIQSVAQRYTTELCRFLFDQVFSNLDPAFALYGMKKGSKT
jgi:hypothetical protein